MQALDWSGRKEMGSPAKGERGQLQGFPEKVGLGWGWEAVPRVRRSKGSGGLGRQGAVARVQAEL